MVPLLSSLAAEDRRGLVMVDADSLRSTSQTTAEEVFGRERDRFALWNASIIDKGERAYGATTV